MKRHFSLCHAIVFISSMTLNTTRFVIKMFLSNGIDRCRLDRNISHIKGFSACAIYNDQICLVTQEIHWRGRNICAQPPLGFHECSVLKFTFFNYLSLPSGTATTWVLLWPTFVLFNECLKNTFTGGAC